MHFTEKEINFLKEYSSIYGGEQCSSILNRPVRSIYLKCRSLKLSLNKAKTLSNEEIESLRNSISNKVLSLDFSIYPKELSYFLGYFWADGYLSKNQLRIEITREDADVIKPIFDKVCSFSLCYRYRKGRKAQACFSCTNPKVFTTLKELGKYPNSMESHEKILNFIPKEYHIWFLRGLIDGDGCIYKCKTSPSLIQFSISNSYSFDWSYLVKYLIDNFNCYCKVSRRISKGGKNSSSYIRCCGKYKVANLLKCLYSEPDNIYLPRKYKKIIAVLENAENNEAL